MEDLDALLDNKRQFSQFIKEGLNIEDDLDLYIVDDTFARIYTVGLGEIYMSRSLGEAFYYIVKFDDLKELREGIKFLINHEIGHFHDNDYLGNQRLENYFSSIKQLYRAQFGSSISSFPDSEATRYALSRSANFKDALAGTVAILSFVNEIDPILELEAIERHYSTSRPDLKKVTDFRLSESLKAEIENKADGYLALLRSYLKVTS
ncbi:MAG: hypothetical protein ACP5TF_03260 [Candidatus Acidifodinimicrobium sp.]